VLFSAGRGWVGRGGWRKFEVPLLLQESTTAVLRCFYTAHTRRDSMPLLVQWNQGVVHVDAPLISLIAKWNEQGSVEGALVA